jgi:hypothetical protein
LFPLFASGVIDTEGKFAADVLVAKFAAGVVDTGGAGAGVKLIHEKNKEQNIL